MKSLVLLLSLISISVTATDYLNGNGMFNSSSQLNAWNWVDSSAYTSSITTENGTTFLSLTKPTSSSANYDDGLYYYFGDQKPQHVHLKINTNSSSLEAGDIRLVQLESSSDFTKNSETDSLFFRFGFYNYMRLNLGDMMYKFNAKTWYTLDFIFNWDGQAIALYVDNQFVGNEEFFYDTNIEYTNAIMLYNLAPETTTKIYDLEVCDVRCSNGANLEYNAGYLMNTRTALGIYLAILSGLMLIM